MGRAFNALDQVRTSGESIALTMQRVKQWRAKSPQSASGSAISNNFRLELPNVSKG
jgi:hypothetical protein